MFKKNIKILIIIYLTFIVSGCGGIKSEKEILERVNKKFGAVELVDKVTDNDNDVRYTLEDKQYGFQYECLSYMNEINIDGSTFYTYSDIACTFEYNYKKYIFDIIKNYEHVLNNNLTVYLPDSLYYNGTSELQSFDVYVANLNEKDVYVSILEKIKEIDNRNYFGDFALEIYDEHSKEKIGVITSKDYKLLTILEEKEKWFTDYANRTFSESGKEDSGEIEFIRKEENVFIKDRKEIYDKLFDRASLQQKDELNTAITTIYYFYDKVAKIEFYIIGYYVKGQACYFNNYNAEIRNRYTKEYPGCLW